MHRDPAERELGLTRTGDDLDLRAEDLLRRLDEVAGVLRLAQRLCRDHGRCHDPVLVHHAPVFAADLE